MLEINNLSKRYDGELILEDVTMSLDDSSKIHVLIGESGSGKTTLFNIIFGLDNDYTGEFKLFEKQSSTISNNEWASIRSHDMRMVFQDYKLLENFTAYENIYLSGQFSEEKINLVFKDLDIYDVKDHLISELSGGQKQRVAIARAVITEPQILLMDEPTGNLDGMTTDKIMTYLDKLKEKGILIVVITHDEALAEAADVVYKLQHKKITLIKTKHENSTKKSQKESKITNLKDAKASNHVWEYTTNNLKRTWKKIFLTAIPTIMIMTMFILAFSAYRSNSTLSFQKIFAGIGDNMIVLDTQKLNSDTVETYNDKGILSSFDGERIGFSTADVQRVNDIDYVKEVILVSEDIQSNYDFNFNTFNQTFSQIDFTDSVKKYVGIVSPVENIGFNFVKNHVPFNIAHDYNKDNVTFISGDFPKDNSNELAIPDVYSLLAFNNEDFSKVVGESINLEVRNAQNEIEQYSYQISGVYNTNFRNVVESQYPIYTGYFLEDASQIYRTEESYEFYRRVLSENPQTETFNQQLIKTYQDYQTAVGTGLMTMIVKVDSSQNIEYVNKELQAIYPSYQLVSQYDLKRGELSTIYRSLVNILVIGSTIIAVVAGILISFLNKGYIYNRSKELAILYSIGYRKKDIFMIISLENVILFSGYFLISIIVAYFSNLLYFSQTPRFMLFDNIFESINMISIILLVCIMLIISIVWGVNGVKQKNLKTFLNKN